jgi:hypothetical protein
VLVALQNGENDDALSQPRIDIGMRLGGSLQGVAGDRTYKLRSGSVSE